MRPHALIVIPLAAVALLTFLALGPREPTPGADEVRQAALRWTAAELADIPRRDGDEWEVDVHRRDGSLVEVTVGRRLELRGLDEELGPGGAPPHDQLTGDLRERAIAAARATAGPGAVRSVERERDGAIEVDFVRPGRIILEVELDRRLRVVDADTEDIGDE